MSEYEIGRSDTEIEGCLIAIEVAFDNDGELTIEQLEDIDDVMGGIGSQRTGQRIEVNNRPDMNTSSVKYVYQESIQISTEDQFSNLFKRFRIKTEFNNPVFKFGTEVVEFKDYNG